MISPDTFGYNIQTAETNLFQHKPSTSEENIKNMALNEFEKMVSTLKSHNINVLVMNSRRNIVTPDAVFPNNWFSSHESALVIYPMLAHNRRSERQVDNLRKILPTDSLKVIDLSEDEQKGLILEGTGSLVLDRKVKLAYALWSKRTTKEEFDKWCKLMGYQGIFFTGVDDDNYPVYHTNVVMSIGEDFAVICLESIASKEERQLMTETLKESGKEIIEISLIQMKNFCGNILQLISTDKKRKIIMSKNAHNSFTSKQKKALSKYGELVEVDIATIEKIGGGSARCMMTEIFL